VRRCSRRRRPPRSSSPGPSRPRVLLGAAQARAGSVSLQPEPGPPPPTALNRSVRPLARARPCGLASCRSQLTPPVTVFLRCGRRPA
jgi:hypothetical protein